MQPPSPPYQSPSAPPSTSNQQQVWHSGPNLHGGKQLPYGAEQLPPPHHPAAPVVINVSSGVMITSKEPTLYTCNNCRNQVTTTVDRSVDAVGWLCCLFGIGLFSFCFDGAYKFTHYCPSCRAVLGVHKPGVDKGMVICFVVSLIIGILFVVFFQVRVYSYSSY